MTTTDKRVRNYLRKIGKKGGHAGLGKVKQRFNSRNMIVERWRKEHPEPKPISQAKA
jgi:hypothetical protein